MAHERETWLDHAVAELLLRGRPVVTADIRAQARADRLAGVLAEAARAAHAGEGEGTYASAPAAGAGAEASGELPGEAAALAAFRQAVGTAGRTVSPGRTADADAAAEADGIGTVRLGPERLGVRIPRFGRPLRLGLAAAMAGCALSGVAAGAGYLYAPSAGESPPRPANSVSGAVTPEPLVSDSPSYSGRPATPRDTPAGTDAGDVPGATGSGPGPSGGPAKPGEKGRTSSGDGWNDGDGEKWYGVLVQACNEFRDGTIAGGKKKLLEGAAKGPQGVDRFCDQLLGDDPDRGGHYEGANGSGGGGSGGGGAGPGGGDNPQSSGPDEGGTGGGSIGGGTDGGGSGGPGGGSGGSGGSGGGSAGPPSGWPGGDYGETIGMNPPEADDAAGANLPPLLPATPGGDTAPDAGPGTAPDTNPETNPDANLGTETGNGPGGPAAPTPDPELPTP